MTLEVNASCCLSSQWCLPFADLQVRLGYFYASSPNKILRFSTRVFFSLSGETCLFCCLNNHKIYEYHFQSLQVLILFFIFFSPLVCHFFVLVYCWTLRVNLCRLDESSNETLYMVLVAMQYLVGKLIPMRKWMDTALARGTGEG